ncbi:MAG TPA: RNA-binding protein [Verrucomicrobiales bacterium]|nr:RNA-binding protein [Verrucomicrobiales bacterium]
MGRHRNFGSRGEEQRRPPSNETVLRSEKIQIERKTFQFTLKENPRGRFLRITEDVGGRRDSIIVPATGLDEFRKVFDLVAADSGGPPPLPGADPPVDA